MKVIDILSEACSLLGLTEELKSLQNLKFQHENLSPELSEETENNLSEEEILKNDYVNKLFILLKFSLRELCTNYLNVTTLKEVESKNNQIEISSLNNYIRLQQVTKNNKLVKTKLIGNIIYLPENGKFSVNYFTFPTITSVFDNISNLGIHNFDVIITGLCAYFCLAYGRFDEFNNFHNQYAERAESLKTLKNFTLPSRRWE